MKIIGVMDVYIVRNVRKNKKGKGDTNECKRFC